MRHLIPFVIALFASCDCQPSVNHDAGADSGLPDAALDAGDAGEIKWLFVLTVDNPTLGTTSIESDSRITNCDTGCSVLLRDKSIAKVEANAVGDASVSLSGDCDSTNCTLSMTQSRFVDVQYAPIVADEKRLAVRVVGAAQVTSIPTAISCSQFDAGICAANFLTDSMVQLNVAADAGTVVTWSDARCTTNTCNLKMNSNIFLTLTVQPLVSLSLKAIGLDAGSVRVNSQLHALPYVHVAAQGSQVIIDAVPGEDDTFINFEGLSCGPQFSQSCTIQIQPGIDAGVRFAPFVHWVKTWDKGTVGIMRPLNDAGSILSFTSQGASSLFDAGAYFPNVLATRLIDFNELGEVSHFSSEPADGLIVPRGFVMSADDSLTMVGLIDGDTSFRQFNWGALDAGSARIFDYNLFIAHIDQNTLIPYAGATIDAPDAFDPFEPFRSTVVRREQRIYFPFLKGFISGPPPYNGFLAVAEDLSDTPVLANRFHTLDGIRKLGSDAYITAIGISCNFRNDSVARFDAFFSCFGFNTYGFDMPRILTDSQTAYSASSTMPLFATSDGVELARFDVNLNVLWRYVMLPMNPMLNKKLEVVELLDRRNEIILITKVASGGVVLANGTVLKCQSPNFSGRDILITTHDKLTGQVTWAQCIYTKPTGAIDDTGLDFTEGHRYITLGRGVLISSSLQANRMSAQTKFGSYQLTLTVGQHYLAHVLIP
jgi:hypothetical protein